MTINPITKVIKMTATLSTAECVALSTAAMILDDLLRTIEVYAEGHAEDAKVNASSYEDILTAYSILDRLAFDGKGGEELTINLEG